MIRTFLVIVILSSLTIISKGNIYEPKWLNHQIRKIKTCSIIRCAPQTCRIRCVPTLTTSTINPTTAITTTTSTITSTKTTVTSTSSTWTTAISTTNTKADYTENQEVILVYFSKWNSFFITAATFIPTAGRTQILYLFMDVIFPFIRGT